MRKEIKYEQSQRKTVIGLIFMHDKERTERMDPRIVVALISGGVSLVVCMFNSFIQARNIKEQNHKTIELIDYKLTKLEETVNKHNKIVERTYRLEEQTKINEEKIKVANHRIEDLEEKEKAI